MISGGGHLKTMGTNPAKTHNDMNCGSKHTLIFLLYLLSYMSENSMRMSECSFMNMNQQLRDSLFLNVRWTEQSKQASLTPAPVGYLASWEHVVIEIVVATKMVKQ